MDCQKLQDLILDSLDDRNAALQQRIDAHLATCPACAAFAAQQQLLDSRLRAALSAPVPSARVRAMVRATVRHERTQVRAEALPEFLHLGSCAVAILGCAIYWPAAAAFVVGAGSMVAASSYALLMALRDASEV